MMTAAATAFDLIVLGAGSGGLEAAWHAAQTYKKRVAVVDVQAAHGPPWYSALGGTCVNVGCVPKKLFVAGALYSEHFKDAAGFGWGIDAQRVSHDWKRLVEAKNTAVRRINDSYQEMFESSEGRLSFFTGWASFEDTHTVVLRDSSTPDAPQHISTADICHRLTAETVLIATGSWPNKPAIPGIEHTISSNEAFYIEDAPRRVLLVGGGYIAVEFAGIFRSFVPVTEEGTRVALAYRGELFLRGFDVDVREELRSQMAARQIDLWFKENPSAIEKLDDGSKRVTFESGKVEVFDVVMYATGRTPRVSGLNLENIGVLLAKNGAIKVDAFSRSTVAHIFAIGDVTDRLQLTPVAIHEGACFADTAFGLEGRAPCHDNVPCAVFAIPPIGTVGLPEEVAARRYPQIAVYRSRFKPLMHNLTGQAHKQFLVKIVTEYPSSRIVGVHLCGYDAPEVIQGVAIAVKMGAKIQDFYHTIGVHPTSAEELCSMRNPAYYVVSGTKQDTAPPPLPEDTAPA